jgi:hypothetical protein
VRASSALLHCPHDEHSLMATGTSHLFAQHVSTLCTNVLTKDALLENNALGQKQRSEA